MAIPLSGIISKNTTQFFENKTTAQNNEDTEIMRKSYLALIMLPNWKEEFEKIADIVITNLMTTMPTVDISETQMSISTDSKLFEFDNKKCVLIGNNEGCDIALYHSLGCSRLHAILFPMPQLGIFVIVDLGSMYGIKTIKRSTNADLVHSLPKQRNTLIFTWGEIAILRFAEQTVAINPKTCIICMENPRDVKFNCGHYSTCADCSKSINKCPICRKPKNGTLIGYDLNTCFVVKS